MAKLQAQELRHNKHPSIGGRGKRLRPIPTAFAQLLLSLNYLGVHLQNSVVANHRMPTTLAQFLHALVEFSNAARNPVANISDQIIGEFDISVCKKPPGNVSLENRPDLLMRN